MEVVIVIQSYIYALMLSFLNSSLILVMFYTLLITVFTNEHARFSNTNSAYEAFTPLERFFTILFRGRIVSRVVLIVSCVGLYSGARFLGNDLKIGWELYHMIIAK